MKQGAMSMQNRCRAAASCLMPRSSRRRLAHIAALLAILCWPTAAQADFGFEVEVGRRITTADGADFVGEPVVFLDGINVTTDEPLFRLENDHRTVEIPESSQSQTTRTRKYSNIEFVSEPINQMWGDNADGAIAAVNTTIRSMRQLAEQFYQDDDHHPLSSYNGIGTEYRLRWKDDDDVRQGTWGDALINPKLGSQLPDPYDTKQRGLLFNHFSVGIPLDKMIPFMQWLMTDGRTYDASARQQLENAVDFGRRLTESSGIPGEDERAKLAGALALFYTQIGAFATKTGGGDGASGYRERRPGQIKNMTAILSRASLRQVRQALPSLSRAWINHNRNAIIDAMADYLEREGVDFQENSTREIQGRDEVKLIDYANSALATSADEIDQQTVFGGMTTVDPHDRVVSPDRTVGPLIVLELRSFRKPLANWSELKAFCSEIIQGSRQIILGHQ